MNPSSAVPSPHNDARPASLTPSVMYQGVSSNPCSKAGCKTPQPVSGNKIPTIASAPPLPTAVTSELNSDASVAW